jgi:2-methylcitrate dehydratase PrpD
MTPKKNRLEEHPMAQKPAPTEATAYLTEYALTATAASIPDDVRHEALRSFVNILGCTVGGCRHDAVDRTWTALAPFAGEPHATLVGRQRKTDALTAALINTLASSVHTFDDTHAQAVVHPSGPVMGVLLALAERRTMTGEEFLTAFLIGVEAICRLSKAISVAPAEYKIAWSQTGITCGVGAALAAARIMRLDLATAQRAVGIATSQAGGIRAAHGTMCTPMMPAQAGQVGLRAALLAEAGITSSLSSIEGRYGFLECFCEKAATGALTQDLGTRFEISQNTYKPYPCGIVIHPHIDAALELGATHGIEADAIETVSIKAHPATMALCFRRHPANDFEGQVSVFQWVAAALVRGLAGIAENTAQAIADPAISSLRDRVNVEDDRAMPIDGSDMTILLKDGRSVSTHLRDCIGSKGRPMSDEELDAKFRLSATGVLDADQLDRAIECAWGIDELKNVGELIARVR